MMIQDNKTINTDELIKSLEPLIRRIIREELERMAEKEHGIFRIRTDMPLCQDMLEIRKRHKEKKLEFYSHKEVWGE